jgi:ribosomal protein S18 acetylase RimI-like enzyme
MPALTHHRVMPDTQAAGASSSIETPVSTAGYALLDNPIWSSLLTDHNEIAIGSGRARRFPAAIGPLSGMLDTSDESYEDLRALAGPGGTVGLFLEQPPEPPAGWTIVRDGQLFQMISLEPCPTCPDSLAPGAKIEQLSALDQPEMFALARLTEPGPFNERTHELGTFFGIRCAGRLVAMAGERLRLPGFVEVSAVCTHPDVRGRGYGSALTVTVAEHIRRNGRTPILHLFSANRQALNVYQRIGFTVRRPLELAVIRNASAA